MHPCLHLMHAPPTTKWTLLNPFPFETMLWQKHASNQEVVNKYHKVSVSSQKYLYRQYMIFPEMLYRWVIAHCVFGWSWPQATVAPANQNSGKQSRHNAHLNLTFKTYAQGSPFFWLQRLCGAGDRQSACEMSLF